MGMQNYCDIALVYGFYAVIDLFVSWESMRFESVLLISLLFWMIKKVILDLFENEYCFAAGNFRSFVFLSVILMFSGRWMSILVLLFFSFSC